MAAQVLFAVFIAQTAVKFTVIVELVKARDIIGAVSDADSEPLKAGFPVRVLILRC